MRLEGNLFEREFWEGLALPWPSKSRSNTASSRLPANFLCIEPINP